MTYSIRGLSPEIFAPLFALDDAGLAAIRARRVTATSDRGFPCRVSLDDAKAGEELILIHHISHDVETPYRSGYAIYVRPDVEAAAYRDMGRYDHVIELVEPLDGVEPKSLLADAYWRDRKWPEAAKALMAMLPPPSQVSTKDADTVFKTAIAAVGNYGEIFARNIGEGTSINLARGLNALWTQGGLQYAPPFR